MVQAVKLSVSGGVLEKSSNGCAVVPIFDQGQIKNIRDVRFMIKEHAVGHFLPETGELSLLLDRLEIYAKKYEEYLDKGDFLESSKTGLRSHRVLVSGVGNEHLSELCRRIQGQFLVTNHLMLPLRNRNFCSTTDDHYKLLERLRNKGMEQSEKMTVGHISNIFYIVTDRK